MVKVFFDKILIFISVKEIVLYTVKSPLQDPLIQWDTEGVPYQLLDRKISLAQCFGSFWTENYCYVSTHFSCTQG